MRADVDKVARLALVNIGLAVIHSAVKKVHVAQEVVHERCGRVVIDFVRSSHLFDVTVVHHHHAICQFECFLLIVGHEEAGDVNFVVKLAQPAAQLLANFGIQRTERFVQQQYTRFDGQGARQGYTLPLSAGKLRRMARIFSLDGRCSRGRTRSPKAMFSNTVMWRNNA